jgi:hypothetical protein
MKNVSMTVILISALTLTLVSTAMFNGIQQVRAEDEESEDDKGQVNTERQQINKCENNSENEDVECNNVIVYGVVCMPGAVCTLENFDVPFELVIPL